MKQKIEARLLNIFLFFLITLTPQAGCLAENVPVVTSIFPVADMVHQVGDPYVDTTFIIPAGASPHTFEPKPSQVKKIISAKIFFIIGAGLETWAGKFMTASKSQCQTVVLSEGIPLIHTTSTHKDHLKHQHPDSKQADNGAVTANPHIWLDPVIAKGMVHKIITALSDIDPQHRRHYKQRGMSFQKEIEKLHRQTQTAVDKFSNKKYVAFHSAWDYFAKRYGLQSVGVIETAPGRNPTPKTIKKIITNIQKFQIRVIFVEPQLNTKVAAVIARQTNVKLFLLDPMGGPYIRDRSSYLDLMRYNLKVFQEAMQ